MNYDDEPTLKNGQPFTCEVCGGKLDDEPRLVETGHVEPVIACSALCEHEARSLMGRTSKALHEPA